MIDDIKCSHVHSTCSFHRNAYSKPLKKNMFELSFELHSRKVPPIVWVSTIILMSLSFNTQNLVSVNPFCCLLYLHFKISFYYFMGICVLACAHEYRYLQNLEDGVRPSGIGVTSGCEPQVLGTRNKTHDLCESDKPFIIYRHLSRP